MTCLLLLLSTTLALSTVQAFQFLPENLTLTSNALSLPAVFDPTLSQTTSSPTVVNSWYSTSYIRSSTDGKQYLLLSHTLPGQFFRSSILDITDATASDAYWQNVTLGATPGGFNQSGGLNITYPGGVYVFEALSSDNLGVLHTKQSSPNLDLAFDITFRTSSPILLNGGLGTLALGWTKGQEPSTTVEWGMPAGVTTGTFTWKGTTHSIDPANSFTWYDRQWDGEPPKNWTWFGLHVGGAEDEGKSSKISFWAIDQTDASLPRHQFATVRRADGVQMVVPAVWEPSEDDLWTSPHSAYTYPLKYTVTWSDGSKMLVQSVREDQELQGPQPGVAYEGYATVSGELLGETVTGFGIIEVVHFDEP